MQNRIHQFYQNQSVLIKGSFFALVGGMIGNFLTYLFQFATGRLLSPSEYGMLVSLRSLMVYGGLLSMAIQTALTKKTSELAGQKQWEEVSVLFWTVLKFLIGLSLVIMVVFGFLSWPLSSFLRIEDLRLLLLTALVAGGGYLLILPTGFLYGLWRFKALAAVVIVNVGVLLVLSVAAIYLGFGLAGVMLAHFLALVVAIGLGGLFLRKNLRIDRFVQRENNFIAEIAKFTGPTLLATISLMAFYNTDILLVKHFFSAQQAGIYSGASIVGRIIFFGTSIITGVMFPVVSGKEASGERSQLVFGSALGMVLVGSIGLSGVYFLFPTQLVRVLFGEAYLAAIPLLPYFAVFMVLYSVLNLFTSFFLAVKRFLIAPILALGAVTQTGAIWVWHDNLTQVVNISTLVTGAMILLSITLYLVREQTAKIE